jgi:uncharacterized protein YbcC (UPF0753/DUF2309 family)
MNTASAMPASTEIDSALEQAIADATGRIAPLWPLSRFVAVNPFVGLADRPFAEAAALMGRATGSPLAFPPAFYLERYLNGEILPEDLQEAAIEAGSAATADELAAAVRNSEWPDPAPVLLPLPSTVCDATLGTRWEEFFAGEVAKWCAAYTDEGQSLWQFPWKSDPLYPAWREAASLDRTAEFAGLPGWRRFIAGLDRDPVKAIAGTARQLGIPASHAADCFHRLLMTVRGWAGHFQFKAHEKGLRGESDDQLVHLLAIRLAGEAALLSGLRDSPLDAAWKSARDGITAGIDPAAGRTAARIWQRAHECARQRELFASLAKTAPAAAAGRPDFQAVFCIDVRSEVYRRALESVAPGGETMGFAGFFGFPIEAVPVGESSGTPQCPVLLTPAVRVPAQASPVAKEQRRFRKQASTAWTAFKSSAVSSFVFVETTGLGFAARFARDLSHHSPAGSCGCEGMDTSAIPLDQQAAMAAGALKHLGFAKGTGLARLVLLCGHGSATANNPFGSSLDCGACGGHTGEANARTAAAVLNDPAVRVRLAGDGVHIPADTWFAAGLHNTTTDEVTIFDLDAAPGTHREELASLQAHLTRASVLARGERAASLGENPAAPRLANRIIERSHDWSQVRPEWGLAGNYAFVAAPRHMTRHLRLNGRVFLHDYRYGADADEATLNLLLIAPVVVASWINLQYFASTIDNERFGAGNKVLHNVTGVLGVVEGNGGDLRVGLPLQSVHDGTTWRHEPLRLSVCVAAPCEAIDRILANNPQVAALVANEWIHLFALDDNGETTGKSDGQGNWRTVFLQPAHQDRPSGKTSSDPNGRILSV